MKKILISCLVVWLAAVSPCTPACAAPGGPAYRGGDRSGTPPGLGNPSAREEARRYVEEALPLLPRSWGEREKYWSLPGGPGAGTDGAAQDRGPVGLYYHNFSISLSTMPLEDARQRDPVPGHTPEGQRWEQFRSVPDRLQSGSYREAVESLGAVIEPRVRLGIEF